MVREALELHLKDLAETGQPIPEPRMSMTDAMADYAKVVSDDVDYGYSDYGDAVEPWRSPSAGWKSTSQTTPPPRIQPPPLPASQTKNSRLAPPYPSSDTIVSPIVVVPMTWSTGDAMSPNAFSATITSKRLGVRTQPLRYRPKVGIAKQASSVTVSGSRVLMRSR